MINKRIQTCGADILDGIGSYVAKKLLDLAINVVYDKSDRLCLHGSSHTHSGLTRLSNWLDMSYGFSRGSAYGGSVIQDHCFYLKSDLVAFIDDLRVTTQRGVTNHLSRLIYKYGER